MFKMELNKIKKKSRNRRLRARWGQR